MEKTTTDILQDQSASRINVLRSTSLSSSASRTCHKNQIWAFKKCFPTISINKLGTQTKLTKLTKLTLGKSGKNWESGLVDQVRPNSQMSSL